MSTVAKARTPQPTQADSPAPVDVEPMGLLSVGVVICAYSIDRWEQLCQATRSVLQQSVPAQELVLVIDHNETLYEMACSAFPRIRVIRNTSTRGLSGARNTGVAEVSAEVVAFLDDDAQASPDWLRHMLRGYDDSRVIGVGGWVEPEWEDSRPAWFPAEFQWVVGCSYRGLPTVAAPVRNPIGANMSFRRAVLVEAGGFSTGLGRLGRIPLGCEETELAIRAQALTPDSYVWLEPAAVVRHHVSAQRHSLRYFAARCWSEGISKARVSKMVGSAAALKSERSYAIQALSRGIRDSLVLAVRSRDLAGAARALAIFTGLALTSAGFVWGNVAPTS
jgi:glycosyltransferase involved in cell wall biosynthesis